MLLFNSGASVTVHPRGDRQEVRRVLPVRRRRLRSRRRRPPRRHRLQSRPIIAIDARRAEALGRLLDAMHEGVFVGTVRPHSGEDGATLVANRALKQLFGHAGGHPRRGASCRLRSNASPTRRRERTSSIDWPARATLTSYPVRMLRLDASVLVVEITAHAEVDRQRGVVLVEAMFRDTTEFAAAEGPLARSLSAAAAGGKTGGARPDHLAGRPRAEQPAGHDPELGGTAAGADARCHLEAGRRCDRRRHGARHAHRPRPAHLRQAAAVDAGDDRPEPRRPRDARAARRGTGGQQHRCRDGAGRRPAAGLCRCASHPAGAAQPDEQRRAGDGDQPRPRLAGRAHLARRRAQHGLLRRQRRRAGPGARKSGRRFSTRSSPPSRSARARGSGWPWLTTS